MRITTKFYAGLKNKGIICSRSTCSIAAILGCIVAAVYALLNLKFKGPAYLTDEIGYLLNAAALAGSKIDGATPYHFGYSLFLIPAFALFDRIDWIWRAVQFTNAILFGFSFFFLYILAEYFAPAMSQSRRCLAIIICSIGPPWLVMSGYAFSNPAFTLIFIISVWMLIHNDKYPVLFLSLHGTLVGFLYWIHPTGLAVAIASFLILFYWGVLKKDWRTPLLSASIIALMVLSYRWMQPILWLAMTPEEFAPTKLTYSGMINLDKINTSVLWNACIRSLGQLSYIIIGTLGFGLVGCWVAVKMAFISSTINSRIIGAFLLLSLLGLISMGSLFFAVLGSFGTDHYIYGRYAAGALLPILLLGILSNKNQRLALPALLIPAIFLLSAAFTSDTFSINRTDPWWGINAVNTPSFWMAALPSSFGFGIALMIGAGASALALLIPKNIAQVLLVGIFFVGVNMQFEWHSRILATHSRPSSIPDIIKNNWPPGTCVAIDPSENKGLAIRIGLYKFLLHNYSIRRMNIHDWATSCNGPLLTSDFTVSDQLTNVILAREIRTGLLLISKDKGMLSEPVAGVYPRGHICTTWEKCIAKNGQDLKQMSKVGILEGKTLRSDGRRGALFFGPYEDMPPGRYRVTLDTDIVHPGDGFIDFVAGPVGRVKIAHIDLIDLESKNIEFDLHDKVTGFEVRLFVAENTQLSVYGYTLIGPLPTSETH